MIKIDEAGNLIGEINLDDLDTNLGQTTEQTQKVWYDFVNQQISGEVVKIDIVNAKILWNKTVSEFKEIKSNETIFPCRTVKVNEGYLLTLTKLTYENPRSEMPGSEGDLISQHLIFIKYDPNGDMEWKKSYNLSLKK